MQIIALARDYLLWHYSAAYLDIIYIARNFLWFFNHFFALLDILKSLFSPFKRLKEEPVNIIRRPGEFFGNLFVNLIMRIVGFVLRTMLIMVALSVFVAVVVFLIAFLFLWTALPALVVYIFISGITYFFT
ncbi:MAG: hypothetical protein A3C93_04805 [Candidatus Lloydbacteria bacterium RIFCSPHIGHO2_02_FULL_54_17]|uniref:Uncharacterized protein n=1 Tax=Candidatus Lloydbacteria bacterium RIFCSPHIGHO2_02_FULL_54_17 TaxID=1798664 RepID=A0A1G2DI24_9BACT|nr:MAG: hypothetical protein A2762_01715 [Candidatus Lloydbacteria bacterium RIFCSPHIGHO2_01_FULL_54_11]OGZ12468.1 MAG: hypothetical protein A3C93_04805 [Candidatus Lloydbacteria bacterium RIFCSPHIGHO2_02_FULL_54_17]OGZ14726.1 MAG: hypothetical protein A2948_04485 [Candidatus Lloydbacteria bacterium RIFCSPLOWO2_01_FULL_54_18]OGZ16754.1 MAG: hypothetical protein A3H76_02385 [Candidatus Lloydbacteria bacterium RIFCSPLOWO2_02_FULL_54_12]